MENRKLRISFLLIGIVVATAMILSQCFSFQYAKAQTAELKKEQKETHDNDSTENNAAFVLSSSTLPSSTQNHASHPVVFLFEILFEDNTAEFSSDLEEAPSLEVFMTLLGAFIAPNAP